MQKLLRLNDAVGDIVEARRIAEGPHRMTELVEQGGQSVRKSVVLWGVGEPYESAIEEGAAKQGFRVVCFRSDLDEVGCESVGLWVIDLVLGEDVFDRVRRLRKRGGVESIVVLAEGMGAADAIALMREGVSDVIEKTPSPKDVCARALVYASDPAMPQDRLVGHSPPMARVRREISCLSSVDSTVMLTGPTGSGKGVVARMIHESSSRRDRPFIHVDCASLAPSVIESELFGHERGSFTGAHAARAGRFEAARDGTIFLDEIGELEPRLQAKLLRVLEDRCYERVGGTRTLTMKARVVAATNRDLVREVREGTFRGDLFFRLSVMRIRLPALRERKSDLPVLSQFYLRDLSQKFGFAPPVLGDGFYERLESYSWPGNVRELINVLERLLVTHPGGVLTAQHLSECLDVTEEWVERDADELPAVEAVADHPGCAEFGPIRQALVSAEGNVSRAARSLGIPRSTLRARMENYLLAQIVPRSRDSVT